MRSIGVLIAISGAVMAMANFAALVVGAGESPAASALLTCISAALMLPGALLHDAGKIIE